MEVKPFRLGDWLVEPALDRLTRNGAVVHLRPQAMDVLAFLASRAGAVVPHDETMAAVWGERFVNEYALTRCIADLRRALGEDARHTQYIENIPKRGYRVVAPVVPAGDDPAGATCAPDATPPENVSPATASPDVAAPTGPHRAEPPPRRRPAVAIVLGLIAGGGALAALAGRLVPEPDEPVTVSQVGLAPSPCLAATSSGTPGGGRTALAFTPDGRSLLFLGCAEGGTAVYVRHLDRAVAGILEGTTGAEALAMAPDGTAVAF